MEQRAELLSDVLSVPIVRVSGGHSSTEMDQLAVEEPLEIRLAYGSKGEREQRSISITMRTPGDDLDLVAGFLYTEGILRGPEEIQEIRHCGVPSPNTGLRNVVKVELTPERVPDLHRLERHFYTTSSCGVCGKNSLEALKTVGKPIFDDRMPSIEPEMVSTLPAKLRCVQACFDRTGGLHASALFDSNGNLMRLREDIGRHNALDKLIGSYLRDGRDGQVGGVPPRETVLLLSGRVSFELMQKAVVARFPVVAAVGAPSSMARDLALRFNVTLIGFVREDRINIYSGQQRLNLD